MKKQLVKRLHDLFYLKENRYEKPKQAFVELLKYLKKDYNLKRMSNIADVGCANGELIYFLKKNLNNAKFVGFDIHPKLLQKSRKKFKDVNFYKIDINKYKKKFNQKYDIVILSGVLSIFDNYKICLENLYRMTEKKGSIYLFNHFNKNKIDVFIKYKTEDKKNILQSGWNSHSLEGIKNFFVKKNCKVEFFKFEPKKSIRKNKNRDLLRSWTFKDNKGKNIITNGIGIIQDQYWIKISKK